MQRAIPCWSTGQAILLQACGGGGSPSLQANVPTSANQVARPAVASKVTHFAASRLAEPATFGPVPALTAAIRAKGVEAWVDDLVALGGPVAGGQVLGTFPDLTLGGRDDGDRNANGRHVPTMATDQIGATLMQWLGLPPSQFHDVFPWLVNFQQKTIPLLRT